MTKDKGLSTRRMLVLKGVFIMSTHADGALDLCSQWHRSGKNYNRLDSEAAIWARDPMMEEDETKSI